MTLSIRQNNFTIVPQNLTEAMTFADMIAKSSFCPDAMKGKSGDVLVAIQMGSEIGLSPMQALQNIAVIKGRPTLWGDAALAVVMAHPSYISHREWMYGSIKDGTRTAYITINRKNSEEYIVSFSIEQAKTAGLWNKVGPWTQYPDRMLQMRARGFAIRDKFADALRGINIREEVEDYNDKPKKKVDNVIDMPKLNDQQQETTIEKPIIESHSTDRDIEQDLLDISCSDSLDALEKRFKESYKYFVSIRDTENVKRLIDAKDKKKLELSETVEVTDEQS
jgi:hypothetical protein